VLIVATGWWRFSGPDPVNARASSARGGAASQAAASGQAADSGGVPALFDPAPVPPAAETPEAAVQRFVDLGMPIWCGGGNEPVVALTFDDGPGPYTPDTVRMLREAGARATFFVSGVKFQDEWLPLQRLLEVGTIGNHTWNHTPLAGAGTDALVTEIDGTNAAIESEAGIDVRLFRPPLGSRDDALEAHLAGLGMLEIMWTFDSEDSQSDATPEKVMKTLERELRPGAIVLFHENRGPTYNQLPQILELLRERGLRPVTVPELLAIDPPTERQVRTGDCA